MSVFSSRLIALRKENKLSQAKLGELINKRRSTISGYETEGKEPDIETLCLLANFFNVSTDYLMGNSNERNNADVVLINDLHNFKKHYDEAPEDIRKQTELCFDAFYRLIVRDVQLRKQDRLEIYDEIISCISLLHSQICQTISYCEKDPSLLPKLVSLQSQLKNDVSVSLDKLIQADMKTHSSELEKKENHA